MIKPSKAVPKAIQAISIFKPMYRLLDDLNKGEVDEVEGGVVLGGVSWASETPLNAAEAIRAWCDNLEAICTVAKLPKTKDVALLRIADTLSKEDIELNESDLVEAREELNAMYKVWVRVPLKVIQKSVLI